VKKFSFLLVAAVMVLGGYSSILAADHLLITEFCVSPTEGEFVEIYNPTGSTIDLTDYYLTDDCYMGDNDYIYVVNGATNVYSYDFLVQFPSGSSIDPGEYQTISTRGADDFYGQYSVYPTYELKSQNASIPNMIPIDVSSDPTLSNTGEMIMLFYWDGSSDLVKDVDYVIWGDKAEFVDKTGVSIDGPDPGSASSTYSADTDSANQAIVDPDGGGGYPHGVGKTAQRAGTTEASETLTGGNGITGHDETSEDMSVSGESWTVDDTATPGEPPSGIPLAQGSLPLAFSLSQNYPNPFNPVTQISFSLPERAEVRLSVYNIVGQKVAELVNGKLDAGSYRVSWDAKVFTSGIYFGRLRAGANENIIKMILLK